MAAQTGDTQRGRLNWYGVNAIGKHVGQALLTALLLFLGAGTTAWPWGRVLAGVYVACWIGLSIVLAIGNPALLNQRGQPVKRATVGTKRWDLVLLSIYAVLVLVQPFTAGLDWRYALSGPVMPGVAVLGNILLILGFVPLTWSMLVNRNFEPSVRIQTERGHAVMTGGPYRFVRHPGYTGVIVQFIALPIALGTWLALVPGVLGAAVFVIRTALEDRTLQAELPGYAAYARQTRYRLLPGIW